MELKTKSFSKNLVEKEINCGEIRRACSESNVDFELWDLIAMNAKLKCMKMNKTEIMNIDDIFFEENIGKIMKIIYNDFKGTKNTVVEKIKDENDVEKECRVTLFLDVEDNRINESRIVLSREGEAPFRLYEIELLIEKKFINKMLHRNIVLIIIGILGKRGYTDIEVESFIKAYLKAVNDVKISRT